MDLGKLPMSVPADLHFYPYEDLLEVVARGGSMDYSKWPSLLQPVIERLNHIVAEEFPPAIYHPEPDPQQQILIDDLPPDASQTKSSEPPSSQDSNTTEPVPQTAPTPRLLPPVPPFSSPPPPPPPAPQPRNLSSPSPDPPPLPAPLTTLLTSITSTLTTSFPTEPPHTIQRLSELLLHPTTHYRTLPAYLRALDRVVSVSSPASIFPLPVASPLPGGILDPGIQSNGPLINGTNTSTASIEWSETLLGSDESLGGALLTPIPWLRHNPDAQEQQVSSPRPIEEPADDSSTDTPIMTPTSSAAPSSSSSPNPNPASTASTNVQVPPRENGAVTQGELIRQEQEAGVVPVTQTLHHPRNTHNALQRAIGVVQTRDFAEGEGQSDETKAEGEAGEELKKEELEVPHARGPDVLGVEDMGLQDGKDVELSLGRHPIPALAEAEEKSVEMKGEEETKDEEMVDGGEKENKEVKGEDADKDGDGDIVLLDVVEGGQVEKVAKDEVKSDEDAKRESANEAVSA